MKWACAVVAVGSLAAIAAACRRTHAPPAPVFEPESLRARIVRTFPHDSGAFTQGLVFHAGRLYESTGLVGRSTLRRLDAATGALEAQVALDPLSFGEGLAAVDGRLIQLTWREGRALLWNLEHLTPQGEFRYAGEGWGLCSDGRQLVMSDGSDRLTRRDPRTFEAVGTVSVHSAGRPVERLNELECVGDVVYANVWQTSRIARIAAGTGRVEAWIDASGLLTPEEARGADVLNGIAFLPGSGHFVLTGKLWPRAFEVEFVAGGAGP